MGRMSIFYCLNNPINFIDPYGLEIKDKSLGLTLTRRGRFSFGLRYIYLNVSPEMQQQVWNLVLGAGGIENIESDGLTYLYQKLSGTGEHLKYGVTNNLATRYTSEELAGGELKVLASGSRSDMLN